MINVDRWNTWMDDLRATGMGPWAPGGYLTWAPMELPCGFAWSGFCCSWFLAIGYSLLAKTPP